MADISKIELPDGNNYDIKDATARESISELNNSKQNKLTAGDNITIENDVISATGGSGGASKLSELSDVDTTGSHSGDILGFDGSKWVNLDYVSIKDSNGRSVCFIGKNSEFGGMITLNNGNASRRFLMFVGGNDDGVISCTDTNGTERINLAGASGVNLFDADGNKTVFLDSETGKVTCNSMSTYEIPITVTKSSGNWSIDTATAVRSGNTVMIQFYFKGNGSSVGVGSNAFVGKLSKGPIPWTSVNMVSYYGSTMALCQLDYDGNITVRILGASISLTANQRVRPTGTYITTN